jgi:Sec7-like guanine-nucleotide exchange factor
VNTFVAIEKLEEFTYKKVKFYSVRFTDNDVNEFFDFLNRMEDIPDIADDLNNLLVWIETIGDKYGAIKDKYFRHEGIFSDTSALPPGNKVMQTHKITVNSIRLYCLVANEHVVFLFNGGIKSNHIIDAKDCPNVGKYIKQANYLTKLINELFYSDEIIWNSDTTDIIFDETSEYPL